MPLAKRRNASTAIQVLRKQFKIHQPWHILMKYVRVNISFSEPQPFILIAPPHVFCLMEFLDTHLSYSVSWMTVLRIQFHFPLYCGIQHTYIGFRKLLPGDILANRKYFHGVCRVMIVEIMNVEMVGCCTHRKICI